jgi:hypothetical protein
MRMFFEAMSDITLQETGTCTIYSFPQKNQLLALTIATVKNTKGNLHRPLRPKGA